MSMIDKCALLLWAVFALSIPVFGQDLMDVRIDRRFELMSVVFRLAEFEEYRMGSVADYNQEVDSYFGPFKNHATIRMARDLRQSVAYDAIPNLAVRASDAVDFKPILPLDSPATHLDRRWKPAAAAAFLKAMADFARDTKADRFFEARESLYRAALDSCREELVSRLDQGWFTRTFGKRDRDTFTLVVAMLNGGGNYGASVPNARGGEDLFALIGTRQTPKGATPAFNSSYLATLVHEFLHSFVNPWVDRHVPELKASGEALNAPVIDLMKKQAYGPAATAITESLVRAFTIRYFRDLGQEAEAQAAELQQDRLGFYWVRDLAAVLAEYTGRRADYADLESFSPKLVSAFQSMGESAPKRYAAWQEAQRIRLDAMYANGPRLISMDPADGANHVDPATAVIRFVFDRPMKSGIALMGGNGIFPEGAGDPKWDSDGKVLAFPVKLKPGTAYRFGLNSDDVHAFVDRNGIPLRPIIVGFKTR